MKFIKVSFILLLMLSVSNCASSGSSRTANSLAIQESTQNTAAAEGLLDSFGVTEPMRLGSSLNRALTALAIASQICSSKSSDGFVSRTDSSAFSRCVGACGLQSWVLINILQALKIESRFVNFYGMPDQGNHTAVEAKVDGAWILLDPTFEVFFNDDQGNPLSTADVVKLDIMARAESIRHVGIESGAENTIRVSPLPLGYWEGKFFSENHYALAEAFRPVDKENVGPLNLTLTLNVGDVFPRLSCETEVACELLWLKETNSRLNDLDRSNDISLLARKLGLYSPYFIGEPKLVINSLNPGQTYLIQIETIMESVLKIFTPNQTLIHLVNCQSNSKMSMYTFVATALTEDFILSPASNRSNSLTRISIVPQDGDPNSC